MDEQKAQQLCHQLIENGYCHVPDVAPPDLIEDIRQKSDAWADSLPEEEERAATPPGLPDKRLRSRRDDFSDHATLCPRSPARPRVSSSEVLQRLHHQQAA